MRSLPDSAPVRESPVGELGPLPSPLRPLVDFDWVRPSPATTAFGAALVLATVALAAASLAGLLPGDVAWSYQLSLHAVVVTAVVLVTTSLALPGENDLTSYSGAAAGLLIGAAAAGSLPGGMVALIAFGAPTLRTTRTADALVWKLVIRGCEAVTLFCGWAAASALVAGEGVAALVTRSVVVSVVGVLVAGALRLVVWLLQGPESRPPVLSPSHRRKTLPVFSTWLVVALVGSLVAHADPLHALTVAAVGGLGLGVWLRRQVWLLALRELELARLAEKEARVGESLRLLYQHVTSENQRERSELASELHDEVLQSLSAAWGMLTQSGAVVPGEELGLSQVLSATRGVIDELHSPVVEALGLHAALRQGMQREVRSVPWSLHVDPPLSDQNSEFGQRLLRVAREIWRTAPQSAGVTHLTLFVRYEHDDEHGEVAEALTAGGARSVIVEAVVEGVELTGPGQERLEHLGGRLGVAVEVETDPEGQELALRAVVPA